MEEWLSDFEIWSMKVYKSEFIGGYGGGGTVVAANNEEEALQIAFEESADCHFSKYDPDTHREYPKYNYMTPFDEIQGLNYEGTGPRVLFCNIYAE